MTPGPRSSASPYGTQTRSRPRGTNRPLGVTIICALGVLGCILDFVATLGLVGAGGIGTILGFLLFGFTVAHFVVIIGLWQMSATALTWAFALYGLGLLIDVLAINLLGAIISLIILLYLASIADQFR